MSPTGRSKEAKAARAPEELAAQLADDKQNRRIFEEQIDMVLDAWGQESIEHNTATWQIPFPHETGIDWLMKESTARIGAHGEVDEQGRVRRVSVVRPHPASAPTRPCS